VGTMGHHRVNGLLMAKSPGIIKQDVTPKEARIEDLAPTLLHLSGLPVPEDMDGRVLLELFEEDFLQANPVRRIPQVQMERSPVEGAYSEEEEAELKRHLENLGYI
jgi:arylsulfatase A-like enzyme